MMASGYADLWMTRRRLRTMPVDVLTNLTVRDPDDREIQLSSLWAEQPIALALIRHFG